MTFFAQGTFMPTCSEHSADTLLTFRSSYKRYVGESIYQPNGWTSSDPRRKWHIVCRVPEDQIGKVAAKSAEGGIGYIELTDDVTDNPNVDLFSDTDMKGQMASGNGGFIPVASPLPASGGGGLTTFQRGLKVDSIDNSSVSLSWPAVSGASPSHFDCGSNEIMLPVWVTRTTTGLLNPGKTYAYILTLIALDGDYIGVMETQTATAKSLPGGRTVANLGTSSSGSSSSYSTHIYTSLGFTRIYFWDSYESCEWETSHVFGGQLSQANYVCIRYLIEGEVLYQWQMANGNNVE
jgi:hypothetical protein